MLINNDLRMVVDPPTAFRGALFLECLYLLMEAGSSIIIRRKFWWFWWNENSLGNQTVTVTFMRYERIHVTHEYRIVSINSDHLPDKKVEISGNLHNNTKVKGQTYVIWSLSWRDDTIRSLIARSRANHVAKMNGNGSGNGSGNSKKNMIAARAGW